MPRTPTRPPGGLLILAGLLAGVVGSETFRWWSNAGLDRDLRLVGEVRELVREEAVARPKSSALLDGALRGMLDSVDPYSRYYDAEETRQLELETAGVYHGVGLSFVPDSELSQVLFALPGSPAARAGVRVGDRIARLDDQPYEPHAPDRLRAALTNSEGRRVALGLEGSDGALRQVDLVPEAVLDPSIHHVLMLDESAGIAYLSLASFTRHTPAELDATLVGLKRAGMRALVLDLRGNLGGLLDSAVHAARLFIDQGTIVTTESRNGTEVLAAIPEQARYAGLPMVVLINGQSASASEVLAGALQDHGAATLVGEPSYGKGAVQSQIRLPELGGTVKLTTAFYRTPKGRVLERSLADGSSGGLQPDRRAALEEGQAQALKRFAASIGPGLEDQPAVRALEGRLGRSLLEQPPADRQLETALEVLRAGL